MKRLIALLLAIVMICAMFAACAKTEEPADTEGSETAETPAEDAAEESEEDTSNEQTMEEAKEHQQQIAEENNANTTNAEENTPPEGAKLKDTLVVATSHDPEIVDPQMNTDNERVQRAVYSALLVKNADGELEPDLATSWECNEAGDVWTFHLREDVTWHNGDPFTAEDVKATFDRVTDKDNPKTHTNKMSFITETVVVDDYTVEVHTEGTFAPFLSTLTGYYGMILNKNYIEEYGDELGKTVESVCGTGPFILSEREWGESVTLTANPDYYKGEPYIKTLKLVVIEEAAARTAALEAGDVDMITNPNASDMQLMKENENLVVDYTEGSGQYFFIYNCSEASILHDARLRQAINYCVDRQAIIDALLADVGATNPHTVMDNTTGAVDLGIIEQDYEKAKELMAEAGYPDGFDIELFASENYMKNTAQAEMIKAMCAEVGININITVGDSATFGTLINGKTGEEIGYDMFCMGMASESGDIDELRGLYTTAEDGLNDENYGLYSNAEADELFAKEAATIDEAERQEYLTRIQEILYLEDPLGLLIYNSMNVHVFNKNVQNFSTNHRGIVYYEYMWVLDE